MQIAGERTGTLRYFGPIALAPGDFCGVELDGPDGKHDGTVRGVCYFRCRPLHGLLAPLHLVRLVRLCDKTPTTHEQVMAAAAAALESVDSGPHSILQLDHVMMDHKMLEADEPPMHHHFDLGKVSHRQAATWAAATRTRVETGDAVGVGRPAGHGLAAGWPIRAS